MEVKCTRTNITNVHLRYLKYDKIHILYKYSD